MGQELRCSPMSSRAMVPVRFESDRPVEPAQRSAFLWTVAMRCRLERLDLQPGPRWRVSIETSKWQIQRHENGVLPAGVLLDPGESARIEYQNVGKSSATFRATLWTEPRADNSDDHGCNPDHCAGCPTCEPEPEAGE